MRCALDDLIKSEGQWIYIFTGLETIDDPFEKNVITTPINSIPVKGLVSDVAFAKIKWAMPGIVTSKSKEIIIPKKYRSLLESSCKIEIRNSDKVIEVYSGWRENSKLQYMIEDEYLRAYIYSKHT